MDVESEEIKEVYARYGLALHSAQLVERSIAILLASVCGPGPTKITQSQYDELLDSNFRKTLGALLKQLPEGVTFFDELKGRLSEALIIRNRLTHNYFWERAGHLVSKNGRRVMLEELDQDREFFSALDAVLQKAIVDWRRKQGITNDVIEEHRQKLIEDADVV